MASLEIEDDDVVIAQVVTQLQKHNFHNKTTITLTFGDVAENHAGMQKVGRMSQIGFTYEDLAASHKFFTDVGYTCELYDLGESACAGTTPEANYAMLRGEKAYFLIIRSGVNYLLGEKDGADNLYTEQKALMWDTKAYMRGRVVNKLARYNLCYDDVAQEPDYEAKKGRIIAYKTVPYLEAIKNRLPLAFGDKSKDLKAEGNEYIDITQCGIGYHGDSERMKVIAVRLGATIQMHFRWYQRSEIISDTLNFTLNHGDMYMMSQKAVGTDWKKKIIPTLRHAAGSDKYVK
jgi:hypothetical protein